jgi:hypothetical protein
VRMATTAKREGVLTGLLISSPRGQY